MLPLVLTRDGYFGTLGTLGIASTVSVPAPAALPRLAAPAPIVPGVQGAMLRFPFAPDLRGTLATVGDAGEIVLQSVQLIIETREGERPMLPDYGLSGDVLFSTMDAGFAVRVGDEIRRKVRRYEPLAEEVQVAVGRTIGGRFKREPTVNPHVAEIQIEVRPRGSNVFNNLVFPVRQLRRAA